MIETCPGEFHTMLLPFPLRPTQCPLCNWITFATKGAGELSTSLSHHLGRQHRIQSKWKWRCSECKETITKYHLNQHRCPEDSARNSGEETLAPYEFNLSARLTPVLGRRRESLLGRTSPSTRRLARELYARLSSTNPADLVDKSSIFLLLLHQHLMHS